MAIARPEVLYVIDYISIDDMLPYPKALYIFLCGD